MPKKATDKMLKIVGIVFILVVAILAGANFLSVISVQDSFSVAVTDYVCTSCSLTTSKKLGPFNESVSFDFHIKNSVHQDDVIVSVVDANGVKKVLFKQYFSPECSGYSLVNHPYGPVKVEVVIDDFIITLQNALTKEKINYIVKGDMQLPYEIEFQVQKFRSRSTVCGVSNSNVRKGEVFIDNILLYDIEPEPIPEPEPEPIPEPEPEPVVEEEAVLGNELTGNVSGGLILGVSKIAVFTAIGFVVISGVFAVTYSQRKKKKGL